VGVKRLGLPWLIALVVIPLLIAAIGYGVSARSHSASPPSGVSIPSTISGAPKFLLAAFSMARNGNSVTLSGDFPDESAKAALMNALNGSLAPGVNIVDQVRINPDVDALDFSKAKPVISDSASIPDFNLTVNGDTITLAGAAASTDQKNTIDNDTKRIWSTLNIVDNLSVNATALPPPPIAAASSCTSLATTISTLTRGSITFGNNGAGLTPAVEQVLTQVAAKLTACPNAHAAVNGYADNSGTQSINLPLSEERAEEVANFLVAHGVTGDQLSSTGFGSADPIAPNDTGRGRAQNRRVEIVIS
jgi:peptidoglycan-binding protein ArfA